MTNLYLTFQSPAGYDGQSYDASEYDQYPGVPLDLTDSRIASVITDYQEAFSLSDIIFFTFPVWLDESLTTTGDISTTVQQFLTNLLTISDQFTSATSYIRDLTDSLTLTDSVSSAFNQTCATLLNIADSVTVNVDYNLIESVLISDAAFTNLIKSIGEDTLLTDAFSAGHSLIQSDSIEVLDTLITTFILSLQGTLILTDVFDRYVNYSRTLTESTTLDEVIDTEFSIILQQAITLIDSIVKSIDPSLSESFNVSDYIVGAFTLLLTGGLDIEDDEYLVRLIYFNDGFNISDEMGVTFARLLVGFFEVYRPYFKLLLEEGLADREYFGMDSYNHS